MRLHAPQPEPEPIRMSPPPRHAATADEIALADAGIEVNESIERHRGNLQRLAEDLARLGVDREEIDRQVIELFRAYQRELARNIDRIRAYEADRRGSRSLAPRHPHLSENSDEV